MTLPRTVGKWIDGWLEQYVRPKIRKSSYVSYEMICRIHLKPSTGSILLTELRPDHIQKMYNDELKNGRVDKKGGLAPKILKNIHNVLHEALEQAVKSEIVVRN